MRWSKAYDRAEHFPGMDPETFSDRVHRQTPWPVCDVCGADSEVSEWSTRTHIVPARRCPNGPHEVTS